MCYCFIYFLFVFFCFDFSMHYFTSNSFFLEDLIQRFVTAVNLPLCILRLMDYPIHIDTISMELFILYFDGFPVKLSINDVFLSLKIVFIIANSVDPDEIWVFTVCQSTHLGVYSIQRVSMQIII